MRTIKFRAKRIDNGEWVYGHYFQIGDKHFISCNAFPCEVDESTLGQFIGRTDKNGTEIFENDILLNPYRSQKIISFWDDSIIGTHGGGWGYKKTDNDTSLLWRINDDELEIIGNVTDNKELLS